MKRYDWSKLDAGWELTPNNNPESVGLLRRQDGWAIPVEVLEIWDPDNPKHALSVAVDKFRKEAKAQLDKCRIENARDHVVRVTVDALNQWSLPSIEIQAKPPKRCLTCESTHLPLKGQTRCEDCVARDLLAKMGPEDRVSCGLPRHEAAKMLFGEQSVVDNAPLFDAMDKMAAEVPAEEWANVPPISNCATERFGCTPCPACGKNGLHLCEKFYPEPPSTKWFHPSQPWCRGPLAAWTLVNISNHDGRLTVVMRRGRSEVLIETGPDDETLWERLGKKAVEADKANSKEKCDI